MSSGLVFLPLIRLMFQLLCAFVNLSFVFVPEFYNKGAKAPSFSMAGSGTFGSQT
jgi:hypothetical protein